VLDYGFSLQLKPKHMSMISQLSDPYKKVEDMRLPSHQAERELTLARFRHVGLKLI
jgi:hypothetical protein